MPAPATAVGTRLGDVGAWALVGLALVPAEAGVVVAGGRGDAVAVTEGVAVVAGVASGVTGAGGSGARVEVAGGGVEVGKGVGMTVGSARGVDVGAGSSVGAGVGTSVGAGVGTSVGAGVGSSGSRSAQPGRLGSSSHFLGASVSEMETRQPIAAQRESLPAASLTE